MATFTYIEIQQKEEKMATIMLSDTDSQEYTHIILATHCWSTCCNGRLHNDGCRVVQKNRKALFATRRKHFTYQVDDVINQVFGNK